MKKFLSGTSFLTVLFLAIVLLHETGCKLTARPVQYIAPIVNTNNIISSVTTTTAQSGGTVVNSGGGPIIADGVCWSSTNPMPTTADVHTKDSLFFSVNSGVNLKGYTSTLLALTPGTTYYVRAYAANAQTTGYGNVLQFTTNIASSTITVAVSTLAGNPPTYGFTDGSGTGALFNGPQMVAYNPFKNNVYVSDSFNNAIRTVTPTGTVGTLTPNTTLGLINGPLSTAEFYGPRGIAFDAQGNAYVADIGNNSIRKITPAGVVSTYAGNGTAGYVDAVASAAEFNNPQGVAVDAQGNVYVADRGNNVIREISTAGVVSTIAGNTIAGYYDANPALAAEFNYPTDVAVDAQGNIYVADELNNAIREISGGAVTTFAGGNGQPMVMGSPGAITIDSKGNLFITDTFGRILEITAAKVLYVLAGGYKTVGYANGSGASALFNSPQGITVDAQGNVYVADLNNNCIRKLAVTIQ
jgi:sugar lactone lactonase YvrE